MSGIEIVRQRLVTNSAVRALVPAANVYPIAVPQGAPKKRIFLYKSGGNDHQVLSGAAKLYMNRISVVSEDETASIAITIDKAVLAALENVVKATVLGLHDVDIFTADTEFTDYDDTIQVFRCHRDFRVHWKP